MKRRKTKTGLLPTTIEGWCRKKRQFMRLLNQETDAEQQEVYENAVNFCDRKVGQLCVPLRRALMIVVILVLTFCAGCGTMAGLQSDIHQLTRPSQVERGQ